MRIAGEPELELFERFARALLHAVRGDLSVVQNELGFLSALYGEENVKSAMGRCRTIAAQLSDLSNARVPGALDRPSVSSVLPGVALKSCLQEWSLLGERESLSFALAVLPELLGATIKQANVVSSALRLEIGHQPDSVGRFCSLSSFISAEVGELGVVKAVVADLVLRHHGYSVDIEAGPEAVVLVVRGAGLTRRDSEVA